MSFARLLRTTGVGVVSVWPELRQVLPRLFSHCVIHQEQSDHVQRDADRDTVDPGEIEYCRQRPFLDGVPEDQDQIRNSAGEKNRQQKKHVLHQLHLSSDVEYSRIPGHLPGAANERAHPKCRLTNMIEDQRIGERDEMQWNDEDNDDDIHRREEDLTTRYAETRFRFQRVTMLDEKRY